MIPDDAPRETAAELLRHAFASRRKTRARQGRWRSWQKAGSQLERVLAVVMEGPSTSAEVEAETGLGVKHCCAHLRNLYGLGIVARRSIAPQHNRGGSLPFMYFMPEHDPDTPRR